jgi:hypothetical protein
MKIFLFKLLKVFLLTFILIFTLISVTTHLLRNRLDPYYVKLLAPSKGGLILGDSRALQGLDPDQFDFPIENFAFTIGHSPYDASYIKLIRKKIPKGRGFQHLVSVTPWSLINNTGSKEDLNPFFSERLKLPFYNPNFEYISKYMDLSFTNLFQLLPSHAFTTDKGWLKQRMDSGDLYLEYPRRVKEKIVNYENKYPEVKISLESQRVQNLMEIISLLKESGSVNIIRLPISSEMLELENKQFPAFNQLLQNIADLSNSSYIDLTDIRVQTTDGNHIWHKEVERVSNDLNRRMREYRN